MKGYIINLSKGSDFEGIVIMYDSIEEGLAYAQANRIDRICVKCNINDSRKKRINFDFLRGLEFIKTFHWLVPLDKRSNIDGMRILRNVEELRWVDNLCFLRNLDNLEFLRLTNGRLTSIEGIDNCKKLKTLFIQNCPSLTHIEDVISNMGNLENLLIEKCKLIDPIELMQIKLKNLSVM